MFVGGTRPRPSPVEQRQRPDRHAPPRRHQHPHAPGPAPNPPTPAAGAGCAGRSNSGCRSRSGSPSAITAASTAASAAGERSAACPQRGLDRPGRPGLAADIDPPRARADRPAPGDRLAHVLALGADPQVPRRGAATQPDLAVVQHRRAGRDRPVPEPGADLVRGQRPGTVLRGCGWRSARTRRSRPRPSTRDTSRSATAAPATARCRRARAATADPATDSPDREPLPPRHPPDHATARAVCSRRALAPGHPGSIR